MAVLRTHRATEQWRNSSHCVQEKTLTLQSPENRHKETDRECCSICSCHYTDGASKRKEGYTAKCSTEPTCNHTVLLLSLFFFKLAFKRVSFLQQDESVNFQYFKSFFTCVYLTYNNGTCISDLFMLICALSKGIDGLQLAYCKACTQAKIASLTPSKVRWQNPPNRTFKYNNSITSHI